MSNDNKPFVAKLFPALMLFCLLTAAWAYGIIQAWPWDKDTTWKPGVRLPVVCAADGETCSMPYADLEKAIADKKVLSVQPKEPVGEVQDTDLWLRWKTVSDKPWQLEASMSSWYFETSVRYSVKGNTLELVQYRHYDAKVFYYAMLAALFTVAGIYLRKLRG
jgi:hypothetical protein